MWESGASGPEHAPASWERAGCGRSPAPPWKCPGGQLRGPLHAPASCWPSAALLAFPSALQEAAEGSEGRRKEGRKTRAEARPAAAPPAGASPGQGRSTGEGRAIPEQAKSVPLMPQGPGPSWTLRVSVQPGAMSCFSCFCRNFSWLGGWGPRATVQWALASSRCPGPGHQHPT